MVSFENFKPAFIRNQFSSCVTGGIILLSFVILRIIMKIVYINKKRSTWL